MPALDDNDDDDDDDECGDILRSGGDSDDDDAWMNQQTQRERDAEIMKLLFQDSQDDFDSDDDDFGDSNNDSASLNAGSDADTTDMDRLSDLNLSMAAAAANRAAQESESQISKAADDLHKECNWANDSAAWAFMPETDQQQEAVLQRVLLGDCSQKRSAVEGFQSESCDSSNPANPDIRRQFEESVAEPMVNSFLERWKTNVRYICDALNFRDQVKDRPVGDNSELTLVFEACNETASVKYVQWSTTNMKQGREIALDSCNRIICPVNFIQRARDFRTPDVHIVIPAVGAVVKRVKKSDRPEMPSSVVAVSQLFKNAIAAHVRYFESALTFEDEIHEPDTCNICLSDHGPEQHGEILKCALCSLSCHKMCSSILLNKDESDSMFARLDLPEISIGCFPYVLLAPAAEQPTPGSLKAVTTSHCPWQSFRV